MNIKGLMSRLRHPFNRFDRFYDSEDIWGLQTQREQFRCKEINRIIKREFGMIDNIIEFGSGEGHQTKYFLELGKNVLGVEPSGIAVERSKRNTPEASFIKGKIESFSGVSDLVIACELMYYLPHEKIPENLAKLERIAPRRIISYWMKRDWLDKYVLRDGINSEIITFKNYSWRIAWW